MDLNDLIREGAIDLEAYLDAASRETPIVVEATEEAIAAKGITVIETMMDSVPQTSDEAAEILATALSTHIVELAFALRRRPAEFEAAMFRVRGSLPRGTKSMLGDLHRTVRTEVKRQAEEIRKRSTSTGAKRVDPLVYDRLDLAESGAVKPTLANAVTILEHDLRQKNRTRHNDFSRVEERDGDPFTDQMESETAIWLDATYGVSIPTIRVHEALVVVAHRDVYNPVKTYLECLAWDKKGRLDGMLSKYFGVEETDDALDATMGRCWMISAVARAIDPGCKVDTVLVLAGEQGEKKSSALEALVADRAWFCDSPIPIGHVDGFQMLSGSWIIELAELDSLNRKEMGTIKAYISSRIDKYRPSYGRNTIVAPRQCVFAGTVNGALVLRDPTGSRRFWVRQVVRPLDVQGILRERDQLWAEAVHRYREGEKWWLERADDTARADDAEQYEQADPWDAPVYEWAASRLADFSTLDVAKDALGIDAKHVDKSVQMRIAAILSEGGWRSRRGSATLIDGVARRPRMWRLSPNVTK